MQRDYVGLASIFLRLAMAPEAMVGSSDIGCQDEARNAIKTITGRIVYEGKKVRISGAVYGELLLRQVAWHAALLHPFSLCY